MSSHELRVEICCSVICNCSLAVVCEFLRLGSDPSLGV